MHVGVIGAGLTGLATVHELVSRNVEVTCFEASTQPGGVIRSVRLDDTIGEYGPQRVRMSPIVEDYLDACDLLDELIVAPGDLPVYIYRAGKLREVPFDLRTGLGTDLLSWRAKLRLLYEPFREPAKPGETAAEYFTRKLGRETYRSVIEPLFGGLYASDPAAMPVEYALAPLTEREAERGSLLRLAIDRLRSDEALAPAVVPTAGMQALPNRIAELHENRITLGTPVDRIERSNGAYRVETTRGSLQVDQVVVATEAPAAARLLEPVDRESADNLGALTYNPLALVFLRASIDARGLGYQVDRSEGLQTLGVSWNGQAFGRNDLHTVFLGGMHGPQLVDRPDEELFEIATGELSQVMNVEPTALHVHRVRPGMPAYDHSWSHLTQVDLPEGIHVVGNYTSRIGIPGRLRQGRRTAVAIHKGGYGPGGDA